MRVNVNVSWLSQKNVSNNPSCTRSTPWTKLNVMNGPALILETCYSKNSAHPLRLNQVVLTNREPFCCLFLHHTPVRSCFTILFVPFVSHCSSISISKRRCKSRADDLLGRAFSPEQWFVVHTAVCSPHCSSHSFGLQNIFSNWYQNSCGRSVVETKRAAWLCIEIELYIYCYWTGKVTKIEQFSHLPSRKVISHFQRVHASRIKKQWFWKWYQHVEIMTVFGFLQIARVHGAREEEEGSCMG
jgi:hypothetical protein